MLSSKLFKRHLTNKHMQLMFKFNAMSIHTIGHTTQSLDSETPLLVYDSKEFEVFDEVDASKWYSKVTKTEYGKKYMELIPFFTEARWKPKYFVLKMELLPEKEYLKFYHLAISGVYTKYVPLKYVVPITRHDYECLFNKVWFKQSPILDIDMIYGHYGTHEVFVFDKYGQWHDEGLEHEKLSLENTYDETNWFDEFTPNHVSM